jgi:hypothetical protein
LVCYLTTELKDKVSNDDLERFVQLGEAVGEHDARVEKKGEETSSYRYKMPESIRVNAKSIDQKLLEINVCDPAIGSGAFPVGMMTEIVRARNALSSYIKESGRTLYNFKRDCIQNSLYGVDIDPGAVEIAKLRLWLSLIVDEDDIAQIKPLPNLDYKIMQGNSLLEEYEGIKLFDDKLIGSVTFDKEDQIKRLKEKQSVLQLERIAVSQEGKLTSERKARIVRIDNENKTIEKNIAKLMAQSVATDNELGLFDSNSRAKNNADELKRLHKEFFETTHKKRKDELKKNIEKLEWDLIEATLTEQGKSAELKKLNTFRKANVKPFFLWKLHFSEVFQNGGFDVVIGNPPYGANIDHYVRVFEEIYPETSKGYKDVYKYFFNCSLSKLLKWQGVLCFITPNTYFLQPRYGDLRKYFLNFNILSLINLGEDVFHAVVPTAISLIERSIAERASKINYADISDASKYTGSIETLSFVKLDQAQFNKTQNNVFVESIRVRQEDEEVLENVLDFKDAGINYQRVNVGLSDKGNSDLSKRLLYEGAKEKESHVEYWKGTDINSFYISPGTNRFVRPNIRLRENERVILNKEYFEKNPKLLWRQTASIPIVAIDRFGIWFGRSVQAGVIKSSFVKTISYEYLCCLLNSSYLRMLYKKNVQESGRVFPQVKLEKLKSLPIKIILPEKQVPFIELAKEIEKAKANNPDSDTENLEKLLNVLVYKLYGLTNTEIASIESSVK